ncbi:MAG TPA: hypothetical protein VE077_20685 [Candidatus Methylomirabilis sp.]|nr:hypothetical protein [Candidatus Methylomirabilis sp.]
MTKFLSRTASVYRLALTAVVLSGFMFFAGAPSAKAEDGCQRRIAKADYKLHEAAERHGWYSPQADHWRHELREARERCWRDEHRWWDQDGHRWHSDRDWDDRDHDRGRGNYWR